MKNKYLKGLIAIFGIVMVAAIITNIFPDQEVEEEVLADTTTSAINETAETEVSQTMSSGLTDAQKATILSSAQIENVPMLNQFDEPSLYNGCEVTSLAMLLNYFGVDVSKNQLAEEIAKVDYQDEEGYYGDPNEGFVGDITGNNAAGYFVYHEPIYDVALSNVSDDLTVVDFSGSNFEEIQYYLSSGSPVWVITTTNYAANEDLETWDTNNGPVEITMSEHSVVLVGYDEEYVYLNDPYGNENYQTSLTDFVASWEELGSQAITITQAYYEN